MTVKISGLREVERDLQKALKDVDKENRTLLTICLQAISANIIPYVPVDTSTLVNSERREIYDTADGVVAEIEYGADGVNPSSGVPVQEYAVYVHEGPQKRWQKPGASNRFMILGLADFIRDDLPGILARFKK